MKSSLGSKGVGSILKHFSANQNLVFSRENPSYILLRSLIRVSLVNFLLDASEIFLTKILRVAVSYIEKTSVMRGLSLFYQLVYLFSSMKSVNKFGKLVFIASLSSLQLKKSNPYFLSDWEEKKLFLEASLRSFIIYFSSWIC